MRLMQNPPADTPSGLRAATCFTAEREVPPVVVLQTCASVPFKLEWRMSAAHAHALGTQLLEAAVTCNTLSAARHRPIRS